LFAGGEVTANFGPQHGVVFVAYEQTAKNGPIRGRNDVNVAFVSAGANKPQESAG
jgi:hypothetical protein